MDIIIIILLSALVLISVNALAFLYIKYAKKKGILAPDIHKKDKPLIPTRGGIVLLVLIIYYVLIPGIGDLPEIHRNIPVLNEIMTIISIIIISSLIGYIDDIKDLGLKKVFLSVLAAAPFYIFHSYYPKLWIPFIGRIRITIVYPVLILLAVPVVINSLNMIDTHNGVMLIGVISVLIPMLLWSIILNDHVALIYLIIALTGTIAIFIWNKYPAKLFLGNTGSYLLGGLLITLIIISGLEFIAFVAMLPIILHGFYLLTSIKGLMTRQVIRKRGGAPVVVEDGIIKPVLDDKAPFTLTRLLILAFGPMTEKELIKKYYLLFAFSSTLAFITGYFIYII